jgi:CheY-like chemotaxis protein
MSPMTDIGFDHSILIVDDDPDIRESLGDLLQHEGYNVHLAGTGGEAIREANHTHYGAVILDIGLPDQPSGSAVAGDHSHRKRNRTKYRRAYDPGGLCLCGKALQFSGSQGSGSAGMRRTRHVRQG